MSLTPTESLSIKSKINRMAEIKAEQEKLKQEWSELEGFFLNRAEDDLRDTKLKSISYVSTNGKITSTYAESLKLVYPSYLKQIFGNAYNDVVTETVTHKVAAEPSRMLIGLWTKKFSRMTKDEIINQLGCDTKTSETLKKKLKGAKFETDVKNLMTIANLDEETAEQYAYFIYEAVIWENFSRLMKITGKDSSEQIDEVLQLLDGAVVVEETPKISFEVLN